ncbi:Os01g0363750 [Oryza sativa Japonica Group]|nr:Os01g0363750 [Oryza sativa Japonica Group]
MTGLIYCVATRRARSMLPEPTSGEGEQLELVPSLDLPAELAADLVTISHFVLQSLPSFPILCRSPRGSPTDLVPRSYAAIIVAVSSSMPLTSRRSRRCPIELGFLRAICAAMERHLGVVAGVGEREGWWWP